jgi:ABC-type glycerol-3-phosphate transport system substrate-binding protein
MRFFILPFCCLLVTACSLFAERSDRPQPQSQPAPARATLDVELSTGVATITLAVPEAEVAGYQQLIEQFQSQHNHIRVRLVAESEIVSSAETDRIAALASAADVFLYYPDVHEGQQYLLDLRPLLNADPAFDPSDFLPGLLDHSDSLWSLPTAAIYPLLFFDKAAFDAAGLANPEPGWTLDEFLSAAQTLTVREGDEVVQWGYIPFQVQPLLATQLATPLVVDSQIRIADPDVANALQWLADLFILHEVSPWLESYKPVALREASGGPDPSSLAGSGRAAMWSSGHVLWQFGYDDDNVGLTTMPRSQQGYAADAIRYGFAASRGTAQPQAVWALLTFLSRQPPVESIIDLLVPARRSVAAADGYWERVPAVMVEPLQYAANNNAAPRFTPAVVDVMRGALTAVVTDHQPVADALAQAQAAAAGQPLVIEADTPLVVATPPGEPATGAEMVPEITFAASWSETEGQRRLATAFNDSQTNVRVIIRRIDTGNPLVEEIAGADCFTATGGRVIGDTHIDILPLNALFDLDPELSPADFHPAALPVLTREGQIWGLPARIPIPLIEYNRALFAAAGIAEPSLNWTTADFLETAQALTDPAVEQYGFVDWPQSSLNHALAQFGVELVREGDDGIATMDFSAAAPVVHWYADLVRLHGVHPALPGDLIPWSDYFDRHGIFVEMAANGQVAMWPYEQSDQVLARRLQGIVETGLAPFPRGPDGQTFSVANTLAAYFISADSPHPQLCWQWLKFLTTQPTASPYLPAHLATAESAAFADHAGAERAAAYLASMAGASDQAIGLAIADAWLHPGILWLTALVEMAAKGEIDVDSGLANAENKFIRYRECVIERQGFDDSAAWQECALGVDPDLSRRYG